jgi:DNA-binding beta-propeller fold protein YncE
MSENRDELTGRALDPEHGGPSTDLTYGAKEPFDVSVSPAVAMAVCSTNHTGYIAGPPAGTVVGTFDTRAHVAGPSITHPEFERIRSVAVDDKRQVVWVASGKAIFPIDTTNNNKVGSPIPMPELALDIAIDATKDTGYVLTSSFSAVNSAVVAFDLETHQPRPFGATSGQASDGGYIAIEGQTGTVFFTLEGNGYLFAIQSPGATPIDIPLQGSGGRLATYFLDGAGFVFVNTPDGPRAITVVSSSSLAPIGAFLGMDSYDLATDEGLGVLYLVNQGFSWVKELLIMDIARTLRNVSADPDVSWIGYSDSVFATGRVAVDSDLHTAFVGAHHGDADEYENEPAIVPVIPVGADPVQITYPTNGSEVKQENWFVISGTGQERATVTGRLLSGGQVWALIPSITVDEFGQWSARIEARPPLGRMVMQVKQRYVLPGGISQFWKLTSFCTVVAG